MATSAGDRRLAGTRRKVHLTASATPVTPLVGRRTTRSMSARPPAAPMDPHASKVDLTVLARPLARRPTTRSKSTSACPPAASAGLHISDISPDVQPAVRGMPNEAVTCFAISVLQCVLHVGPFRRWAASLPCICPPETDVRAAGDGKCIACALGDLVRTAQRVDAVKTPLCVARLQARSAPSRAKEWATRVRSVIHNLAHDGRLVLGVHNDAHELLTILIEKAQEAAAVAEKAQEAAAAAGQIPGCPVPVCPLKQKVTEVRTCMACGTTSKRTPHVPEVMSTRVTSTPAAQYQDGASELMEFTCANSQCKGGKLQEHRKEELLMAAPDVVAIHVLRYTHRRVGSVPKKIRGDFVTPLTISVPVRRTDEPGSAVQTVHYNLRAVVEHIGHGADKGHYVAYVLHSETWHKIDDMTVEPVPTRDAETGHHLFHDRDVHLAFYERRRDD